MGVSKILRKFGQFCLKNYFLEFRSHPLTYLICISKLNKESQNNKCFHILYWLVLSNIYKTSINI